MYYDVLAAVNYYCVTLVIFMYVCFMYTTDYNRSNIMGIELLENQNK